MLVFSIFGLNACTTLLDDNDTPSDEEVFVSDENADDKETNEVINVNVSPLDSTDVNEEKQIYLTESGYYKKKTLENAEEDIYFIKNIGFDKNSKEHYYEYSSRDALRDEHGNPIYVKKEKLNDKGEQSFKQVMLIENGNIVYDEKGNVVYEYELDEQGNKIPEFEEVTAYKDTIVYKIKTFNIVNNETKEIFGMKWPYEEIEEVDENNNKTGSHIYQKNISTKKINKGVFVKISEDERETKNYYYIIRSKEKDNSKIEFDPTKIIEESGAKFLVNGLTGDLIEKFKLANLSSQLDSGINTKKTPILVNEKILLNKMGLDFSLYISSLEKEIRNNLPEEIKNDDIDKIVAKINDEKISLKEEEISKIAEYQVALEGKSKFVGLQNILREGIPVSFFSNKINDVFLSPETNNLIIDVHSSEFGSLQDIKKSDDMSQEEFEEYNKNYISFRKRFIINTFDFDKPVLKAVISKDENFEILSSDFVNNDNFVSVENVRDGEESEQVHTELKALVGIKELELSKSDSSNNILNIQTGDGAFITKKSKTFEIFDSYSLKKICERKYNEVPGWNEKNKETISLDKNEIFISVIEKEIDAGEYENKNLEIPQNLKEEKNESYGILRYNYRNGTSASIKEKGVYSFLAKYESKILGIGIEKPPSGRALGSNDFFQSSWSVQNL
jgi:hypothetical protein